MSEWDELVAEAAKPPVRACKVCDTPAAVEALDGVLDACIRGGIYLNVKALHGVLMLKSAEFRAMSKATLQRHLIGHVGRERCDLHADKWAKVCERRAG